MEPTAPLAVLALLLVWLAIKVGFIGAAAWFAVARPELLAQIEQAYRSQRGQCYLFGVINGGVGILVALVLLNAQVLALLGVLIVALLLAGATAGYAACYADLGQRLHASRVQHGLVRRVVEGGVIAETAFFLPLVGQILSLLVLFRGLGAVVITLLARRRATREAAAPLPEDSTTAEPRA